MSPGTSGPRLDVRHPTGERLRYRGPMVLRRSSHRWLSGWLVFALLFMQLAGAAYACPQASSTAAMPCAQMMSDPSDMRDPDQPGLCAQHCKPMPQSADASQAPVPAVPALLTMVVLTPAEAADAVRSVCAASATEARATPPPSLSILHCCWRI